MIIQDLFKKVIKESEEDFINYYLRHDEGVPSEDDLRNLLKEICECRIKEDEENNIIFSIPDIGGLSADSFLIKQSDLKKKSFEKYAYELCPMEEILGYQVSDACIGYVGEFFYLASILYEMTFFGYSLNIQKRRINKEKKILEERVQEIKEGNLKLITLEELKEKIKFKDTRKVFEKKFDLNKLKIEGKFQKEILKELIKLELNYRRSK